MLTINNKKINLLGLKMDALNEVLKNCVVV